jgi:hypothetical protein
MNNCGLIGLPFLSVLFVFLLSCILFERSEHARMEWSQGAKQAEHHHHHVQTHIFLIFQVNHRLTIIDRNQSSNKTWKTIICTKKFGLLGKFCYRDTYAPSP